VQIAAVSLDWIAPGVNSRSGIGTSLGTPAARAALPAGFRGAELADCRLALARAVEAGAALAGEESDCADGESAGWNCDAASLVQPESSPAAIMAAPPLTAIASIFVLLTVLSAPNKAATHLVRVAAAHTITDTAIIRTMRTEHTAAPE